MHLPLKPQARSPLRSRLYHTLVSFATLVSLAACSLSPATPDTSASGSLAAPGETTSTAATSKPNPSVTISFGIRELERNSYELLVTRFERDNPGIRVALTPVDNLFTEPGWGEEKVRAIVSAADVVRMSAGSIGEIANPTPYLLDLAPLMAADASFDQEDFFPAAFVREQGGTAIYGLQRTINVPLLFFNRDLLATRGIPEPAIDWTVRDVLAMAQQVAQKRGDTVEVYGFANELGAPSLALANALIEAGVDPRTSDPATVQLTQPAVVQSVEQLAGLIRSGALYLSGRMTGQTDDTTDITALVQEGRVAIWDAISATDNQSFDFSVGVAPMPPSVTPTFGFGDETYIISRGTANAEAAWRWLTFLTRVERPGLVYPGVSRLLAAPSRRSVAEKTGYWKDLEAATGVVGAEAAVRAAVAAQPRHYRFPRILPTMFHALGLVISKGQSVEAALEEAQQRFNERNAEAQGNPRPSVEAAPVVVATPSPDAARPEVTTTIVFGGTNRSLERIRPLAEKFMAENPSIEVRVESDDTSRGVGIDTLAESSDCFTFPMPPLERHRDLLLDLQPLSDGDAGFPRDDYPRLLLEPFRANGKLYGLPDQVGFQMLEFNKEAFDTAGLPYPNIDWTMNQLLDVAQQLTGGEGQERRYGFVANGDQSAALDFFLDRFGAQPLREHDGGYTLSFRDPQTLIALRYYMNLLQSASPHDRIEHYDVTRDYRYFDPMIEQGRVGMWFSYIWSEETPDLAFTRMIAPKPLGGSGLTTRDISELSGLYISARSQQPEACWQWLRFLADDIGHVQQHLFPARMSLASSEAFLSAQPEGAANLYAAYREALERSEQIAEAGRSLATPADDLDTFWFLRAVERGLQGGDLERELDDAQFITDQFLACRKSGEDWRGCARQVDSTYTGQAVERGGGSSNCAVKPEGWMVCK